MKRLLYVFIFFLIVGCKQYDEVDFQSSVCKTAPTFKIKADPKGSLRYELSLDVTNTAATQYPFRTIWTIENKTFTGSKVSYQFGTKGKYPVSVVFYNACLMEGKDNIELTLQ